MLDKAKAIELGECQRQKQVLNVASGLKSTSGKNTLKLLLYICGRKMFQVKTTVIVK